MKSVLLLVVALAATVFAVCPDLPDGFGYTCIDTNQVNSTIFPFLWESPNETFYTLQDDDVAHIFQFGFQFEFYGASVSAVEIGSNGFLSFDLRNVKTGVASQPIPEPGSPTAMIAGWWLDLFPPGGGSISSQVYGVAPNRHAVVEFLNIPHYSDTVPPPLISMEFKLFETTNVIEIHYLEASADEKSIAHTIGIENGAGNIGLMYERAINQLPTAYFAIRFTPPTTPCAPGCYNGGNCVAPGTASPCECPVAFNGTANCDEPQCVNISCLNGGVCSAPEVCDCRGTAFSGANCNQGACLLNCKNNGTCVGSGSTSSCACPIHGGYEGDLCETPKCTPECQHSGTCIAPNKCACQFYDLGQYCEIEFCPKGCQHGGICVDAVSSICDCTGTGYTGTDCTIPVCTQNCGNKTCVLPNLCAFTATTTVNFGGNRTDCHQGQNLFPSYGCATANATITGYFLDPLPTPLTGSWTVKGVQVVVATSICGKPGFTGAPVTASMGSYNLSTYDDIPVCTCNAPNVQYSARADALDYVFGSVNTISSQVISGDIKTAFCLGSTGVITIAYDVTPPVHTTGRVTTGSSFIIATTGGISSTRSSSAAGSTGAGENSSDASSMSATALLAVIVIALLMF